MRSVHSTKMSTAVSMISAPFWGYLILPVLVLSLIHCAVSCPPEAFLPADYPFCPTAECGALAESLRTSMDLTANPCDDFARYACGNWNETHDCPRGWPLPWSFEECSISKTLLRVDDLLDNPLAAENGRSYSWARDFYLTCLRYGNVKNNVKTKLLNDLISKMDWTLDSQLEYETEDWDFENTMIVFRKEYGIDMLFSMYVSDYDGHSAITVDSPTPVLGRVIGYRNAAIRFIKAAAAVLKLGNDSVRERSTKIIEIEREIFQEKYIFMNETLEEGRMSIDDMQSNFPFLDWLQYFTSIFGYEEITLHTTVFIKDMKYLRRISDIVSELSDTSLGRKTLAQYFGLRVIREMENALPDDLQSISGRLFDHSIDRKVYCLNQTVQHFNLPVTALFRRNFLDEETQSLGREVYQTVQDRLILMLREVSLEDENSFLHFREKLESMGTAFPFEEEEMFESGIFEEYGDFQTSFNYFTDLLAAKKLKSVINVNSLRNPALSGPQVPGLLKLKKFHNGKIFILPRMLLSPLFHKDYPGSINFGSLGFTIADEMIKALYAGISQGNSESRGEASRRHILERLLDGGEHVEVDATVSSKISSVSIRAAFAAYKVWSALKADFRPLPLLNLTHDKLFFVQAAQLHCLPNTSDNSLDSMMRNSPEFLNSFNCPPRRNVLPEATRRNNPPVTRPGRCWPWSGWQMFQIM